MSGRRERGEEGRKPEGLPAFLCRFRGDDNIYCESKKRNRNWSERKVVCSNIFCMCLWDLQRKQLGTWLGERPRGACWGTVHIEVVSEAGAGLRWPRKSLQNEKILG